MRISDWSSDVCFFRSLRELLWRLREARPHILLLPLRKAEIDDRLGSDLAADGADQFGGEGGARQVVAAPSVGASVGALPQEIVDHIAVGAVDRDAVEADLHRPAGAARKAREIGRRTRLNSSH